MRCTVASILQIQASGAWASQCFARYLHVSEEDRQAVQMLVSSAISSAKKKHPYQRKKKSQRNNLDKP